MPGRTKRVAVYHAAPTENLWDLPSGWRWKRLHDVGTWGSGGTPKASEPKYYDGPVPWVRSGELDKGTIFTTEKTLTELGLQQSSAKWAPAGSLLVALYGANIGQTAISGIRCTTNQAVAFCVPNEGIDISYLFRFIQFIKRRLGDLGQGGAQPNISQAILREFPIPLSSLHVQRSIAKRIDELFAEIDDGERALAEAHAGLDTYRNSLLNAAVTGQLTADWRISNADTATGDDLLKAILLEHRQAQPSENKGADPKLRIISMPTTLPKGWTWASFRQLTTVLKNGVSAKPDADESGIPILRISAVRPLLVDSKQLRRLSKAIEVDGYWVNRGDFLVTRYNGSPELVGVCGRYRGTERVVHPDKLIRLVPASAVEDVNDYIELAVNVGASREFIAKNTKTTAGQHGVSGETIGLTPIPLPPLREIAEIMRLVRIGIGRYRNLSNELDSPPDPSLLRQSILSAAFRGEFAQ